MKTRASYRIQAIKTNKQTKNLIGRAMRNMPWVHSSVYDTNKARVEKGDKLFQKTYCQVMTKDAENT